MRDEHLDSYHQEAKSHANSLPNDLDADEIQPLLFDLVRLDKVEAVKSILHHFNKLDDSVKNELRKLAASFGSAAMVQLICNAENCYNSDYRDLIIESIQCTNFETLRCFLSLIDNRPQTAKFGILDFKVLIALFKFGPIEMYQQCEKYFPVQFYLLN